MVISASRRTDIPSYFSEWFFNRLQAGYVLVRNPMNPHQVSQVSLSPDVVDAFVFWTKNPAPMLQRLEELKDYPYYFQFTLTAYGPEVETGLPSKNQVIIPVFQQLSQMIGRERVVWRYDPIFLSSVYTAEYHYHYFSVLAAKLAPYTEKCTISFLDFYAKTERNTKSLQIQIVDKEQQYEMVRHLADIARQHHLKLDTCAEAGDFEALGIGHASCIDKERLEQIGNCQLKAKKDRNQRAECGCIESIDIGAYHSCPNGCLYCYANDHKDAVLQNLKSHDPKGELLFGQIIEKDVIKERAIVSQKEKNILHDGQLTL